MNEAHNREQILTMIKEKRKPNMQVARRKKEKLKNKAEFLHYTLKKHSINFS